MAGAALYPIDRRNAAYQRRSICAQAEPGRLVQDKRVSGYQQALWEKALLRETVSFMAPAKRERDTSALWCIC
jgi:hypothetical protein